MGDMDPLDRTLEVNGNDYTPIITCQGCHEDLIDDSNGNAPLWFTARELLAALDEHECSA